MKKELIGKGANWAVSRITLIENDISKTIVFKEPLKTQSPDKNIRNYKLVLSSGLPTLSKFLKRTINEIEGIEAEDLNPEKCDGYYVSPNTIRNSKNCASVILECLSDRDKSIPDECKGFNIEEYINYPEKISDDMDALIEKRILIGAEKYVYENKIRVISNLNAFLINSKADMKKASDNRIELFSDAFFFRVTETTKEIDYKIADFDCIISHRDLEITPSQLFEGNLSYFETALNEFFIFFIEEKYKEMYLNEIRRIW